MQNEPPNLAEIKIREEIRSELVDEMEQERALAAAADRDRRFVALVVSISTVTALLLPALAAIMGLSWRILKWAAGY
jgi:hypothetical protein